MHRLITIPISHYCEKARWALERAAIPYREEAHLQFLHYLPARRFGGSWTVPVLVTHDGSIFSESSDILAWADEQADLGLFPQHPEHRDAVRELCRGFDDVLGPHSRLWMYQHFLTRPDLAARYATSQTPRWQQRSFAALFRPVAWFIKKRFSIDAPSAERSLLLAGQQMDRAAERLEKGGEFLVGECFTAADLCFACMAAPLLMPPEYGVPLPSLEEIPAAAADVVASYRRHPAGRFALRMFREQRPPPLRLRLDAMG